VAFYSTHIGHNGFKIVQNKLKMGIGGIKKNQRGK